MTGNPPLPTLWKTSRICLLVLAVTAFLIPAPVLGQMNLYRFSGPQLLYVTPAGGKAGTTVELTVQGQNLDELQGLYFSHPGLKAEPLGGVMPTSKDSKVIAKGMQAGVPSGAMKFKVAIAPDVPLGIHDVRLITPAGVSNPRAFVVGDQQELVEAEPNNDVEQAQKVELGCAIHGTIGNPTDVDYYSFTGKKGERVLAYCQSSSIDSKLQPNLQLFSSDGRLLALNHNYHKNEALLDATLPEDGSYLLRVSGFAYIGGGPDYFYRVSISTAPWIDAIHPAIVEPGKATSVTIYGRNLPGGKLDPKIVLDGKVLEKLTTTITGPQDALAAQRLAYSGWIDPPTAMLDGFEFRLKNHAGYSNPALVHLARAPVIVDNEANDTAATAQAVRIPCTIAGRIEKKADRDWYVFRAEKGQVLTIEAIGDRLGAALDLHLVLVNAETGKTIAELDDTTETTMPSFYTRTDDPPEYRFVVPATGKYQVMVSSRDAFVQSGPRHLYRVRITPTQPDFRLIALPPLPYTLDGVVVRQGSQQFLNVIVHRSDGFNGEIQLSADNLPAGVTCPAQVIPRGSTRGVVVFTASDKAGDWTGEVKVVGKATIDGREVVREVRAGGPIWPAPNPQQGPNTILLSRLTRGLVLAVRDHAPYTLTARAKEEIVKAGKSVTVPIELKRHQPELAKQTFKASAVNLPKDLTLAPLTLAPGKDKIEAAIATKTNTPPGMYTVVLLGETDVDMTDPRSKKKAKVKLLQPSTPIIFTVLPAALAKVKATPASTKLVKGKEVEVVVAVTRQFDHDGPFKVSLSPSTKAKGITATEVTIPAGANEAKLLIRAAPDASLTDGSLTIQAVTMFLGRHPITHEAKVNLTLSSK